MKLLCSTILLLMAACTLNHHDKELELMRKSLEKSFATSHRALNLELRELEDIYKNECEGFKGEFIKVATITRVSNRFYKLAVSIYQKNKISRLDIQQLRIQYQNSFDSIKKFYDGDYNISIQEIEKDYNLENSTFEYYKLFVLMLKNNLLFIEVPLLHQINHRWTGERIPRTFVYCESYENKENSTSQTLELAIVKKVSNALASRIDIDSITFNNTKLKNFRMNLDDYNNQIVNLNGLKRGLYNVYGTIKQENSCKEWIRSYSFNHAFLKK